MTITEAQKIIDIQYNAGLISTKEAAWLSHMIRRTEGYGTKWSWKHQARMRANLLN